jgi:hypothetical protein
VTLAFLSPGAIGSPVDVATFVVVMAMFVYELRPTQRTLAAGLVALARREQGVDDERLQADLGVDEDDVEAIETTIVRGDSDG